MILIGRFLELGEEIYVAQNLVFTELDKIGGTHIGKIWTGVAVRKDTDSRVR